MKYLWSMLQLLSWNIQQGGGSRAGLIANYLCDSKMTMMVLSEFRNNEAGVRIRKRLMEHGYIHQASSGAPRATNGVLVASKLAFDLQRFDESIDYAYGMLEASFSAFRLIGVYLPHKKKHKLFDHLLEKSQTPGDLIIAGDFNTGKNYVDQKGDSFWYTDQLLALEDSGMKDAFRYLHEKKEEFSWYSHQGNGFRYDHTYVTDDLLPVVSACYYDHSVRTEKLSDHSAMILKLGGSN